MKVFSLIALLLVALAMLAYQNNEKARSIAAFHEAEQKAAADHQLADLREAVRKVGSERNAADQARNKAEHERDQVLQERDQALHERDEARQQATVAAAEIGRLTNSTPKPQSWFEKRQAESGGKLDAPAADANTRVRSYPSTPAYYSR
jgi:uncharacterized protein (DUF3084 family)